MIEKKWFYWKIIFYFRKQHTMKFYLTLLVIIRKGRLKMHYGFHHPERIYLMFKVYSSKCIFDCSINTMISIGACYKSITSIKLMNYLLYVFVINTMQQLSSRSTMLERYIFLDKNMLRNYTSFRKGKK